MKEFNPQRELEHLKKIVEKDDEIIIKSRYVKHLVKQAERVQELVEENRQIKRAYGELEETVDHYQEMLGIEYEALGIDLPIERIQGRKLNRLKRENEHYKQALEEIKEMSKDSVLDRKYFEVVTKSLGNENE